MATDISKVGNVVQVTEGEAQPVAFSGSNAKYFFNAAGDILNLTFGISSSYAIDFEDLTVGGIAPADTDAAYTALSTVFPSEGGGSGTTPTLAEVLAVNNSAGGLPIVNLTAIQINIAGQLQMFSPDGTLFLISISDAGEWVITED